MALFDRDTGKLIVRVVYDGPGNAGKTTNLVEISRAFTPRRRSELVSPEEHEGRTVWFDWIQVDGGLVAGHPLRCQIVTVPGQFVLRRRRMALLRTADVVVMVCDSTPDGLARVKPAYGRIRQFVEDQAGRDVPIVIQANKQDLSGAVSADEVAARLGADAAIPVVAARAREGVGVRETLVLAIRAAANRVQQLVLERGLDALAGTPDDAETVLAELRRLDSDSAIVLSELGADAGFADDEPAPREEPPELAPPSWWPAPPLASSDVAPGNLWPAATGRDVLRTLANVAPRSRADLVGQSGLGDGSGKSTTVIYEGGGWCMKTSMQRRFTDLERARAALQTLARNKLALGDRSLQPTLLVIGSASADRHWVWTFTPWRTTLRAAMAEAAGRGDVDALTVPLVQFARAAVGALVLALEDGIGLDLHPSNFAIDGDRVVYLDDEIAPAPPILGAAHAILQRAEEYAKYPEAIAGYTDALVDGLVREVGVAGAARVGLIAGLEVAAPRALAALALRLRLLDALDRRGGTRTRATLPLAAPREEQATSPSEPPIVTGEPEAPASDAAEVPPADPTPPAEPVGTEAGPEPTRDWPEPPLAAEQLPSGYIWPVIEGRELVRRLATQTPVPRTGDHIVYDVGDYTISTSPQMRFSDVDDGRAELLRLARARVARGEKVGPDVLVLAPTADGDEHWIWTFSPAGSEACASR